VNSLSEAWLAVSFNDHKTRGDLVTQEAIQTIQRELLVAHKMGEFCEWLAAFPESIICEALLPIAAQRQRVGVGVLQAAQTLFILFPRCPWTCQEAVRMLLDEWDISLEEVPWYLASVFPEDELLEMLRRLKAEPMSQTQAARLGAVRYWVDIYIAFTAEQANAKRQSILHYF
jgi:hypothetical protein